MRPVGIRLRWGWVQLCCRGYSCIGFSPYAREFYGVRGDKRSGGLVFPGNQDPDYWDFLYYSLVVAMTAQVSDVQITNKTIRRLTSVHGVVSLFFNVAVLALSMNIVSSLME
jgi:uncharacterized membrane protein